MINSIWTKRLLRSFLPFYLFTLFPLSVDAQGERVVRGDCLPDLNDEGTITRGSQRRLPAIRTDWNKDSIYRQLVLLVEFEDTTFSFTNPQAVYDSIFNCEGYNQRYGKGCVAEYFRDQSDSLFNMRFDVFGPYRTSSKAQPYDKPTANTRNYGKALFVEAVNAMLAEHPETDYSVYDWDKDGNVDQIIFVYAGPGGNASQAFYGHIWPNTSSFSTVTAPDGTRLSNYSASNELLSGVSAGIGTICHEFSHCLGLPDIYPTKGTVYSVLDEWDLMDGGNFTNYGWCPPNYTPLEKMLLGWFEPEELTEAASITNLKPVSEGGTVYKISHTASEYYLLENRQQIGWDFGLPGKGLVVYHVNYDKSAWGANKVNGNNDLMRFELVAADNLDYASSMLWAKETYGRQYLDKRQRLNSFIFSNAAFPWIADSAEVKNCELTDSSIPSARMTQKNKAGSYMLSKPITNIRMSEDGLISFDFMGGVYDGISSVTTRRRAAADKVYNLQGQQVAVPRKGIYIVDGKKVIIR